MNCLTKDCPNKSWARGLCVTCLSYAHKLIQRGEITDAELVANGKWLAPKSKKGPSKKTEKRRAWFLEGKDNGN